MPPDPLTPLIDLPCNMPVPLDTLPTHALQRPEQPWAHVSTLDNLQTTFLSSRLASLSPQAQRVTESNAGADGLPSDTRASTRVKQARKR